MTDEVYRVKVEGSDKVIICQETETLLLAMARQGIGEIPVGCRNGGCGVCKIRVVKGEYESGKMSVKHVSKADRERGLTLTCKTFPKSDLTVTIKT